ncbi:hypothetical protein DL770_001463 [Monosporascus sp. CRB-9-2]|nr:hypothetical protein DL770_001463 [Monosporascus sp. CRB-9-2]
MAILSLYWANLFEVDKKIRNFAVNLVDFDAQVAPYDNVTPVVGPTVVRMAQMMMGSVKPPLGYAIASPSQYDYDPIAVRQAVYNFDCYAAVIINPNATAFLQDAVTIGNSSYDPTMDPGVSPLQIDLRPFQPAVPTPVATIGLVFWAITNVAASFYSLELARGFFRCDHAWPLHRIVQASRQILFNQHSRVGFNLGVLFAWSAVNVALFPLCC